MSSTIMLWDSFNRISVFLPTAEGKPDTDRRPPGCRHSRLPTAWWSSPARHSTGHPPGTENHTQSRPLRTDRPTKVKIAMPLLSSIMELRRVTLRSHGSENLEKNSILLYKDLEEIKSASVWISNNFNICRPSVRISNNFGRLYF